jgi:E3 ubiquitin-protein ligase HECTD1
VGVPRTRRPQGCRMAARTMEEAMALMRRAGVFVYESDFDTNGLLFWLGTNGKTTEYVNPHTSGKVVVTASSVNNGTLEGFIGHAQPDGAHETDREPMSFVAVQFPLPVVVTRYTLRHGWHSGEYRLQNWNFEGSNNGVEWVVLRQHVDDQSLEDEEFSTASWDVNPDSLAFSHFRILQNGENSSGEDELDVGGLELYGHVDAVRSLISMHAVLVCVCSLS